MTSHPTVLSPAGLNTLRNDSTLGSGNFLDRCYAVNPCRDVDFLFFSTPLTLPSGVTLRALGLETLMSARRSLAEWYSALGVTSGDVVAVCVSDGIAPFLHYVALSSLGAAAALINPAMPPETAAAYVRDNDLSRLIVDVGVVQRAQLPARLAGAPVACVVIDDEAAPPLHPRPLGPDWPRPPEDSTLIMLSHTSGTTGAPKAVCFEHRQFFMGKRARIGQFAEAPDERVLSALPQSHSSAISHLETVVLHGIPTLVLSQPTGEPVRQALRDFAPTTVLGFPQTFGSLVRAGVAPNEFPSVRRWFSMGDAAHEHQIRGILVGAPESRFIDAFGSSELGMALFRKVSTKDAIAPRRAVGRPVDVAVAKILTPDTGDDQQPGQVGLLAVRAPTVTPGYWRRADATAKAWRNGYFLTGDVGFCRDGDYHLIDRVVDVIASRSGPLYTLLIEEEIQKLDDVSDASVVGSPQEPGDGQGVFVLVLPTPGGVTRAPALADRVLAAVHRQARAEGRPLAEDAVMVALAEDESAFPLGATGKVLKRKLRELCRPMADALAGDGALPAGMLHLTNGIASIDGKPSPAEMVDVATDPAARGASRGVNVVSGLQTS